MQDGSFAGDELGSKDLSSSTSTCSAACKSHVRAQEKRPFKSHLLRVVHCLPAAAAFKSHISQAHQPTATPIMQAHRPLINGESRL